MKNSSERPSSNEFEKRIASYSEMPDDVVWDNIDKALRPNRMPVLMAWWDGVTGAAIALLFLTTTFITPQNGSRQLAHNHRVEGAPTIEIPETPNSTNEMERLDEVIADRIETKKTPNDPTDDAMSEGILIGESMLQEYEDNDSINLEMNAAQPTLMAAENVLSVPAIDSVKIPETVQKTEDEKESEEKSSKQHRLKNLKFYVAAAPLLNFYHVIPSAQDGISITGFETASILSSERLSVSFSAGLQGYISKRFEYYGGVTFFHRRTSLRYSFLTDEIVTELDPDLVYTITPAHNVREVNFHTRNVGLQGGILFLLYGKKLMHKVGAGLQYYKGFAGSGNEELYRNHRASYLSYQLFYRNEIVINRRLKFFVQPTFTNSLYVDEKLKAPFKLKPYSAGIGFGAVFQLD